MNTARDTIFDLIADVRCSQRHIDLGENVERHTAYRDKCKQDIAACFSRRHNFKMNKWGWPDCMKEEPPNLDSCLPDDWLPDHKEY